ncbi:hypothetical protein ACFHW2_07515 [Actinomadura sp. LOL_016]|uniref:hypothetical protein n=1 Tax=Actinomadura sp. LOL_016 TaxID=3345411 RepID=UPI003A87B131
MGRGTAARHRRGRRGARRAAGLLALDGRVRFGRPRLRSAAYRAAAPDESRAVHRALAEATDPGTDADRHAWHRAQSVVAPDETVAEALERSMPRARERGGLAAGLALRAGTIDTASGLLATATAGPLDARERALAGLLSARLGPHNGRCGSSRSPASTPASSTAPPRWSPRRTRRPAHGTSPPPCGPTWCSPRGAATANASTA